MATNSLTFTGRLRSFKYALRGIRIMLASQHNAWIHAAATLAVAGKAKDVAAGAVLLSAAGSVVIGLLVLGPHVFGWFRG